VEATKFLIRNLFAKIILPQRKGSRADFDETKSVLSTEIKESTKAKEREVPFFVALVPASEFDYTMRWL